MKKLAALALGSLILLASCSSGSSTSAKTTEAPTTAAPTTTVKPGPPDPKLEAAARSFIEAFIAGDVDAVYGLYTARCKKVVDRAKLKTFIERSQKDNKGVTVKSVTSQVNGSTGTIDYTLSEPKLSRKAQHWKFEGGSWHNDEC